MRTTKINQLEKIVSRILDLSKELDNADFNGESESKIAKLQEREDKALDRGYEFAKTCTEEEFDATSFEFKLCMSYEEAIS